MRFLTAPLNAVWFVFVLAGVTVWGIAVLVLVITAYLISAAITALMPPPP
jgi:hypothetical protein